MVPTDPRWDSLTDADWDAFAIAWTAELAGDPAPSLPDLPILFENNRPKTAIDFVVPMNFTASAAAQWKFILAAYLHENDSTFGHLAAGPVEHLLGTHGDEYIEQIEHMANEDPFFAGMLKGCYKYRMSDAVWERLCATRGDG